MAVQVPPPGLDEVPSQPAPRRGGGPGNLVGLQHGIRKEVFVNDAQRRLYFTRVSHALSSTSGVEAWNRIEALDTNFTAQRLRAVEDKTEFNDVAVTISDLAGVQAAYSEVQPRRAAGPQAPGRKKLGDYQPDLFKACKERNACFKYNTGGNKACSGGCGREHSCPFNGCKNKGSHLGIGCKDQV